MSRTSSSRSSRARRKRTDPLAVVLSVLSLVGLPVLGFAAYKLYNRPPTVIMTVEHVKTDPVRAEPTTPEPPPVRSPGGAMASAQPNRSQTRGSPFDDAPLDGSFGPGASGGAGGRAASTADALDQIAGQVEQAIGELHKKVLLVWLFDRSSSNEHARLDVLGRLDPFYGKLAAAEKKAAAAEKPAAEKPAAEKPADDQTAAGQDAAVLSVVGAFGPDFEFVTPEPTADAAAVKQAAQSVKSNSNHVENTFAAIQAAVEKYSKYRLKGRFVSLIVVSDEAGDDEQKIDQVLPTLKRYTIPVYCIGVEASFGRIAGANQMAEGSGATKNEIRVRQGPESRFPEWIHLQYPGGGNDSGLMIDTGLGPYSLTRLCQQTNGEYFALPQIGGGYGMRDNGFGMSPRGRGRGMREPVQSMGPISGVLPEKYAPKYLPEQEIQAQLIKNKAKKALVEASMLPEAEVLSNPETRFANDDDVKRTRALDSAQKPAARIMPGIDALYNALKAGEGDEPKLADEPRWQVGYDLAFGRAMAAKARADGYMSQLAVMKSGRKFKDPKSTTWILEATDEPSGVSVVDKQASKSRELLKRVIKDHPGTPWAKSAEMELQAPLGWKWTEQ